MLKEEEIEERERGGTIREREERVGRVELCGKAEREGKRTYGVKERKKRNS